MTSPKMSSHNVTDESSVTPSTASVRKRAQRPAPRMAMQRLNATTDTTNTWVVHTHIRKKPQHILFNVT